jgi:hypothetical protein
VQHKSQAVTPFRPLRRTSTAWPPPHQHQDPIGTSENLKTEWPLYGIHDGVARRRNKDLRSPAFAARRSCPARKILVGRPVNRSHISANLAVALMVPEVWHNPSPFVRDGRVPPGRRLTSTRIRIRIPRDVAGRSAKLYVATARRQPRLHRTSW